ncbi:MAG: LamG-like jellyroll fold domain-containing protein, partial [Solirubrobacterales bacterium]
LALFASAATARLVADYRFDGNLQSSVGGASEAFASGANLAFRTEDVARCNRQVATFPVDQGVAIHTKDVIGSGSYTMIMQARFESVPPDGYVRAINWFPSFAVDNGLYLYQGKLDFYDNNVSPADHQGTATVQPNRYVELAVSREAGSKLITGYVNGAPQFTYTDTFDQAVSPHPAGNVYFFVDNGNEESAGAIARIRVYDHVLPAGEILNTVGCFEQRCGGTAVTLVGDDRGNVLEGTPARDAIEDWGAPTRSGGWRGTTSSAGTRARTSCSAARAGTGCWEVRARTGWREPRAATPAAARPGATVARAASGVAVSRVVSFPAVAASVVLRRPR